MKKAKKPTKPLNKDIRFRQLTNGWTIEAPTEPLRVPIEKKDCEVAKKYRRDPENCVVAQGIRRSLGPLCRGIIVANVGNTRATVTFYDQKRVLRYKVPPVLRRALRVFDQTGLWNLPEGIYFLLPMTDSELYPIRTVSQTITAPEWNGINAFIRERACPTRQMRISGSNPFSSSKKSTKYKLKATT